MEPGKVSRSSVTSSPIFLIIHTCSSYTFRIYWHHPVWLTHLSISPQFLMTKLSHWSDYYWNRNMEIPQIWNKNCPLLALSLTKSFVHNDLRSLRPLKQLLRLRIPSPPIVVALPFNLLRHLTIIILTLHSTRLPIRISRTITVHTPTLTPRRYSPACRTPLLQNTVLRQPLVLPPSLILQPL